MYVSVICLVAQVSWLGLLGREILLAIDWYIGRVNIDDSLYCFGETCDEICWLMMMKIWLNMDDFWFLAETTQIFDELDSDDGAVLLPRSRDGPLYVLVLLGGCWCAIILQLLFWIVWLYWMLLRLFFYSLDISTSTESSNLCKLQSEKI